VSAQLVRGGEGEVIYDHPIGGIELLSGGEGLVVSLIRLGPGNPGPAAHIHHEHSDGFYVLDGELTLRLGDGERQLGTGGFVLIPPGVVHTVRNPEGADDDVLLLNLHAPGADFDGYLRAGRDGDGERRERFDQDEPPADGGRPASDATLVEDAGDGEHGVDGGHVTLGVVTLEPGAERALDDRAVVYVLEGELAVGDGVGRAAGDAPARFVTLTP
jgi:quercetin dioxygenase-like cupin family protein